jgi:hypothetical protein
MAQSITKLFKELYGPKSEMDEILMIRKQSHVNNIILMAESITKLFKELYGPRVRWTKFS